MDGSAQVTEQGGICLTFDDWFAEGWFSARALFRKYDARCTFYVARPDRISRRGIRRLRQLEDDGHEIGFHTLNHPRLKKFLQTRTLEDYIETEIDAGLEVMKSLGFSPASFSYPYHKFTPEADVALLERFDTLRYRHPANGKEARLVKPGETRVLNVLGSADMTGEGRDVPYYQRRFKLARRHKSFAVFCGHNIGTRGLELREGRGAAFCDLEDLEKILRVGRNMNLRFEPVRYLT